jgi:hypothetical protein
MHGWACHILDHYQEIRIFLVLPNLIGLVAVCVLSLLSSATYLGSYERPWSFNHQCLHCYKGKICDLIRYTVLLFAFGRGKIVTDTDLDFLLQTNPDTGFDEQR